MPLALGLRFLTGYAVSSDASDRARPEWPPHPARVFMALAAAHFANGSDADERDVLRLLETLPPPLVAATDASPRDVTTHYVPVNDRVGSNKAAPLQSCPGLVREKQPRIWPRVFVGESPVQMIWPDVNLPPEHAAALARLCARVTRLGHSSSLVQLWIADHDTLETATWVPDGTESEQYLRQATPGLLEELRALYQEDERQRWRELVGRFEAAKGAERKRLQQELDARFAAGPPAPQPPSIGAAAGYARPRPVTDSATTQFDTILPLRLVLEAGAHPRLGLASTLQLTAALRGAMLARAAAEGAVPEWLSGHAPAGGPTALPHIAYFPLPFVGRPHADGHLLGVGLALPRSLGRESRQLVRRLLAGIDRLTLGRLGAWRLEGVDPAAAFTLRRSTWTAAPAGARVWASVTPVAFDQHPKAKDRLAAAAETQSVLTRSLERIVPDGSLTPELVFATGVAAHAGVPSAGEFPRLGRPDGSLRRHSHAIVLFPRPVIGPVLVGAGRYRGYGLFKPLVEELVV